MLLDDLLAGSLILSVLLFALAGGADFGGGVWTLLARRGQRSEEQQQLVERAIGPIWEVNELWIIVAVVILWTCFTPAFAAYGTALFVPFVLAITGILLRGAFLAFRLEAQEGTPGAYKFFGELFGSMSIIPRFSWARPRGLLPRAGFRSTRAGFPPTDTSSPGSVPSPSSSGSWGS